MSYPISENIAKLVERLSDDKDIPHKSLYIIQQSDSPNSRIDSVHLTSEEARLRLQDLTKDMRGCDYFCYVLSLDDRMPELSAIHDTLIDMQLPHQAEETK